MLQRVYSIPEMAILDKSAAFFYQRVEPRMKHSTAVLKNKLIRGARKKEESFVPKITFISLHDSLSVCSSSSIEGIKVFNMTIYKNLAAKITTNHDMPALNGRIRTLFRRESWTIN